MSFASDVDFLQQHGDLILLASPNGGQVAVSAKYQGRVMTSATAPGGTSLGWVNRDFITSGKVGTAFDNYGGEDRFWLGPEGGQYSVFFPPSVAYELSHWQTPGGFQQGIWEVTEQDDTSVDFKRDLRITNRSEMSFDIHVARKVEVLDRVALVSALGVEPDGVQWVAFRSDNRISNVGTDAWTKQSGLVSIWSLGMFVPADDTWVIAPYEKTASGPVVCSDYFGALPADRLKVDEARGAVLFLADGRYRSKIGLSQARAKNVAASYTPSENRLTLIRYSVPSEPRPFVNSTWQDQTEPFAGDLFNSYCHGTTTPGPLADVRFYELESSSPGAELEPGQSLSHEHQTCHFIGERAALESIATRALGVSLAAVPA